MGWYPATRGPFAFRRHDPSVAHKANANDASAQSKRSTVSRTAAPSMATQASNDPFSLRRSAQSLHEVAHLVARLAKHADHLQRATAETADLHTSHQALSDVLVVAASALKTQCQPCLESLAAVQGLSCSDDLMDELLHRMFSSKSTDMEDAGMPMLSPMTSLDAIATSLQDPA